jgi:hypothetical protein
MAARERGPIGRAACLAARSMVLLWDAFVAGARTVTGLELIGLMWRALVAALVGVFWVSFARRRESQYLLATGGYTEQWR